MRLERRVRPSTPDYAQATKLLRRQQTIACIAMRCGSSTAAVQSWTQGVVPRISARSALIEMAHELLTPAEVSECRLPGLLS